MNEFEVVVGLADKIVTIIVLLFAWQAERRRYDVLMQFVLENYRRHEAEAAARHSTTTHS